jgi:hypothetical protein
LISPNTKHYCGPISPGLPSARFTSSTRIGSEVSSRRGTQKPGQVSAGRDLRRHHLSAAEVIDTAGSSSAAPRLKQTLTVARDSARADGLRFQLVSMRADMPRQLSGRQCVPAA